MEQQIIQKRVQEIYDYLDKHCQKGTFEYNPKFNELITELSSLRLQCSHVFNNGQCIYCKLKMI